MASARQRVTTALVGGVKVLFVLLMVILPVPVVSFLDKTRARQRRNEAAQLVKSVRPD